MQIGGIYKSSKTGLLLKYRAFEVRLRQERKGFVQVLVDQTFQLFKESAYSYRRPVEVEITLDQAVKLVEELEALVTRFIAENHATAISEPESLVK